jgi:Tfp pilus assembly protein PilX
MEGGASLQNQAATNSWYWITARGTGGINDAVVILQSIFMR